MAVSGLTFLKLISSGNKILSSMSEGSSRVAICWLRNDLRYHDNEILLKANINADQVLPVYCYDPRHFKGTYHFNFPKTGSHRARFLLESVANLRNTLREKGSDLVVRLGQPEQILPLLVKSLSARECHIVYQEEVTKEEKDVEIKLKENCRQFGVKFHPLWGLTLYHRADIPFPVSRVPDTYTGFRKAVEAQSLVRAPLVMPDSMKPLPPDIDVGQLPTLAQLGVKEQSIDRRTAFPFSGGESHGLARLRQYLWETDNVFTYKETRNGLLGSDYSTKFSPWLAHGCLSPRHIHAEVRRYEKERQANQSTYWVLFEMIWRDYFKFVCMKFGDRVFYPSGIMGKKIRWKKDHLMFQKWKEGRTGIPFVDANMRELQETGWMSNRGRQNVASFLIKDMGLDWRLGAEWFESQLLDHDVCSNYGNWNYAAGIGNDPRENRKFNMIKQAFDYDPKGDFVRCWVPELAGLKEAMIHTPWKLTGNQLTSAGIALGDTYPNPILVAPEWGRHQHKGMQGKGPAFKGPRQRGIDFYFKSPPKV
ncbi:cryptochrome DASH-like isoform X1 [Portunus trituberculatus]|uniref:cryptochrome DASH-like isoform X1 n=2 Tax=Portunus trituberculatus TaxID=210409 RepID=UPI001E1CDECD|nr:cryptochrome DASH-like isoform X1 [Portunus trituberculatus]